MAPGTLFGGWRIVGTMGSRITRLTLPTMLVAKDIVIAWVVTMPASGAIGAVFFYLYGMVG